MNNKYLSKYSNNKPVSAAQYITEIICERKAQRDKADLHYRFWLRPEWELYYKNQIASAHAMLKKYPDTAIVRALNSSKAAKIYSLRAPHLPAIIEEEAKKLLSENQTLSVELKRPTDIKFKKKPSKQRDTNIISRLKELDNEPE